jgi:hypothetical protein
LLDRKRKRCSLALLFIWEDSMKKIVKVLAALTTTIASCWLLAQQPKLPVNPDPNGEKYLKAYWEMLREPFEKGKIPKPAEGRCKSEMQYFMSPNGGTPNLYIVTAPPTATIVNVRVYSRENIDGYRWEECPIALGQQCPQGGNAALPYEIVRDPSDQSYVVRIQVMNWSGTLTRLFRVVVDYNMP